MRCCGAASTSATSRSRCCSATTSSTSATSCSRPCHRAVRAARGDRDRAHGGRPRADPPLRLRRGRADRRPRRSSRSPGSSRSPRPQMRPRTSRSSAATCCAPRSSTCSRRPNPARAARSSSPTRCRCSRPTTSIAGGVYGVVFDGRRYDTGDRLDYIKSDRAARARPRRPRARTAAVGEGACGRPGLRAGCRDRDWPHIPLLLPLIGGMCRRRQRRLGWDSGPRARHQPLPSHPDPDSRSDLNHLSPCAGVQSGE